ncbi:MAG: RsmB/NOP family class I SAM-dependent RNA methyltransferase [Candidatus Omnitrophica bacterium]|nr:RsmB/NOP family class I SAM-dependent RNA methyltransferase [Candidatus Omnitrophota bacterium]
MKNDIKVLPEVFLDRLRRIFPPAKFDEAANTFAEPKPTTFRVNTLKADPAAVKEALEHAGFILQPVHGIPSAFSLKRGSLRDLQKEKVYREGKIYVQSIPSMIPALVLDPRPGEEILDLTAAPGSKTTQIACLMGNKGKIVANDNDRVRFFKLKANVEGQGASIVELSLRYGEAFGKHRPESFDRVLLDAPCSAEGRFLTGEPASYRYWKPAKVKEMVRKQKKLFFSAVHALRTGGILVYSTCTYAPEENEGVLDWALKKFPAVLELEPVCLPFPNQMPGLGRWEKEEFDPRVRRAVRLIPTAEMEGFFVARLRKKNPAAF